MTLAQSFVKFLENKGYGVFGQNIYLYRVPNSRKTETEILWLIPMGGYPSSVNKTGEMIKAYQIQIYYRSNSARKVDEVLNDLESTLNCSQCVKLEGFELVTIRATQLPADQDLDSENRMVGTISCQLEVYKSCEES